MKTWKTCCCCQVKNFKKECGSFSLLSREPNGPWLFILIWELPEPPPPQSFKSFCIIFNTFLLHAFISLAVSAANASDKVFFVLPFLTPRTLSQLGQNHLQNWVGQTESAPVCELPFATWKVWNWVRPSFKCPYERGCDWFYELLETTKYFTINDKPSY